MWEHMGRPEGAAANRREEKLMGPRADFSCRACAKAEGRDGFDVHADLPVDSKRCPIKGTKINRLFNAVNVGSADARAHAKIIDNSTLGAQHDAAQERKENKDVLKIGAGSALGAVQSFPGAAQASRQGAIPIIKSLQKPRPISG